jgi:TM2 domain-containing membrane protein YozV/Tfp pilus assembly major pilin PilA
MAIATDRRYKSKTVAGLFGIFAGSFGIHRFYLGQWRGILYLLFCWTMIPGIFAFFEGIDFLATARPRWDKKYNEGVPDQGKPSAGLVVALVVSGAFFVMVIGALATVVVTQYFDMTTRSMVMRAIAAGEPVKKRVEEYASKNRSWPASNADIGLPDRDDENYIEAWSVGGNGVITMRVSEKAKYAAGDTFVLSPRIDSGRMTWSCDGGTLAAKYRPVQCRPDASP